MLNITKILAIVACSLYYRWTKTSAYLLELSTIHHERHQWYWGRSSTVRPWSVQLRDRSGGNRALWEACPVTRSWSASTPVRVWKAIMVAISPFSLFRYLTADINSDCDSSFVDEQDTVARWRRQLMALTWFILQRTGTNTTWYCSSRASRCKALKSSEILSASVLGSSIKGVSSPSCGKVSSNCCHVLTSVSNVSLENKDNVLKRGKWQEQRWWIGLMVIWRRQTIEGRGSQTYQGMSSLACRMKGAERLYECKVLHTKTPHKHSVIAVRREVCYT